MIQNEDYIEFDLKALFFYILRQWKAVLSVVLVAALLMGSYATYSEHIDSLAKSSRQEDNQQLQRQIVLCESRVSDTQSALNALEEYLDHSVLMNINHRNVHIAKATYYMDSGYQILTESTFQNPDKNVTLAWYYCNLFTDYSIYEEIGAMTGIDAKYLMELVHVESPNRDTVSISVLHSSGQLASAIMTSLQEKMQETHLQLKETVSDHTLTLMLDSCGTYIDETLHEAQQNSFHELETFQADLLEYTGELESLKNGHHARTQNIAAVFIKWFILGGAVGGVLIIVFLCLKSILRNRLHAGSQLVSSFHATVLGEVVRNRAELSPIAKRINWLEGCLTENSEENYQFLAENIKNHCGDAHCILICCDTDANLSTALAGDLNRQLSDIRLLPVGNMLREADALRSLSECDAVVMIAARDRSRNTAIRKMLKLIGSYKKEFLGFIVAY